MKLPKKARRLLHFRHKDIWYQITEEGEKYLLYRCGDTSSDYEMLGSGNSPIKLEERVYSGKIK